MRYRLTQLAIAIALAGSLAGQASADSAPNPPQSGNDSASPASSAASTSSEKPADGKPAKEKDRSVYDPKYRPKLKPVPDDQMVTVTVDGEQVKLTPQEYNEIRLKRRAVLKDLYQQKEMDRLKSLIKDEDKSDAYHKAVNNKFQLTPDQILDLRKKDMAITRAQNTPVVKDVKSSIRTINLDVDSAKPVVLNVSKGFISSLVFFDQNGNPWPIDGDVIGDDSAFKSQKLGKKGHIVAFEIKRSFAQSNALIELKGLDVPISVRLVGEEGKVDAKLSVRIPRFGPESDSGPVQTSQPLTSASPVMMSFLNDGRIKGGTEYGMTGVPGTVYYLKGALYIRSKATLAVPPIQPPLSEELKSPTGYKIYKIPPVTNLMFTQNGRLIKAKVHKIAKVKLQPKQSIFPEN